MGVDHTSDAAPQALAQPLHACAIGHLGCAEQGGVYAVGGQGCVALAQHLALSVVYCRPDLPPRLQHAQGV